MEKTPDIHTIMADAVRHHQAQRFSEAMASYRQALALDPDLPAANNNLGRLLWQEGRLADAEACFRRALAVTPNDGRAHSNLGVMLWGQGRPDDAVAAFRRALALMPDDVGTETYLGNVFYQQGKLGPAEACFRHILALAPDFGGAHNNLGNVLLAEGRGQDAEFCFRRARDLEPDNPEAHNNLGAALWQRGAHAEAEASYRRALQLRPGMAEARNNLANALSGNGKLDEAAALYRQSLAARPDDKFAADGLAAVLRLEGDFAAALQAIHHSLQIQETQKSKNIFVEIVRHLRWQGDNAQIRALLVRALTEPWARPDELARTAADMVKQNLGIALEQNHLLHALLCATQNTDIELERFLTRARRDLLAAAEAGDAAGLEFASALARQCFINEYVFCHDDDEIARAGALRDGLAAALEKDAPVTALCVLAVASYFPLGALSAAARLLETPWPDAVAAVLVQQISEPAEEAQLRAAIPRATPIADAVSARVRAQYEENPYPRWVKAAPAEPETIVRHLRRKFPFVAFADDTAAADILLAGCGTGQHAIEVAQNLRGQVLAVDLSRASLGYAERKTKDLGLASITYMQADLLELGGPTSDFQPRDFNVIECAGVLHHLADPFLGWDRLLSLLRPSGFMMIGLYSLPARRDVGRARAFIAEKHYGPTADDIRRCRQDLLSWDQGGNVAAASDFFGISSCRDLLFHAHERAVTLAEIAAHMANWGLSFLGFELDGEVLAAYRRRFPADPAAVNLDHWREFEQDNPDTFAGMYSFWIQKPH